MNRKKLLDRVKAALAADNTIVVDREKLNETKGFTTEYLAFIGLSKNDLRHLEANGLAMRGYAKIDTMTTMGKRKSNHQLRWILLGDANAIKEA